MDCSNAVLIVAFMNGNVAQKLSDLVLIRFVLLKQASKFFVGRGINGLSFGN